MQVANAVVRFPSAATVCEGTKVIIEEEMDRIAGQLRVTERQPIDILLTASTKEATARCGPETELCTACGGCTLFEDPISVITAFTSLPHELVHAYRRHQPDTWTNRFFEEGIAERFTFGAYYNPYYGFRGETSTIAAIASGTQEFDGPAHNHLAGHFVNWLIDHFGEDAVVSFYVDDDDDDIPARFERHFGMTIEAADVVWRQESELEFRLGDPCPVSDIVFAGEPAEIEVDAACGGDGIGPVIGLTGEGSEESWTRFCFESMGLGEIEMTVLAESDEARVSLSKLECEGASLAVYENDKRLTAGEGPVTFPFAPCRWTVGVYVPTSLDTPVTVRFAPP